MWFRNRYRHKECNTSWEDEHSRMCNDHCPVCDAEIEPEGSDDLTVAVLGNNAVDTFNGRWGVHVSAESAEDTPDYVRVKSFDRKAEAEAFAEELGRVL